MPNYRNTQRQDHSAWPPRQSAPDAQTIHLGRIADALEGILECLVGIQAQIPEQDSNHHPAQPQFMREDHSGV
jgi:hypothetical protein